eukprot:Nk52_evm13s311 gene=Nk52_evmTU13s311
MAPTIHFWGEPTSNVNWCEHDYAVSGFVAEFWNTITSFMFAFMGFLGMSLISDGHSITKWSFFWLCSIGFGSAAFHGTLQYSAQLLDEVPMIWGSCCFIYSLTILDRNFKAQKELKIGLFLYCFVSAILMGFLSHSPAILPVLYLILVAGIIVQSHKALALTGQDPAVGLEHICTVCSVRIVELSFSEGPDGKFITYRETNLIEEKDSKKLPFFLLEQDAWKLGHFSVVKILPSASTLPCIDE